MSDAKAFDHMVLEAIDEARRRDVDEEVAAAVLRNHAETVETDGFDAYTSPSGVPEGVEDA